MRLTNHFIKSKARAGSRASQAAVAGAGRERAGVAKTGTNRVWWKISQFTRAAGPQIDSFWSICSESVAKQQVFLPFSRKMQRARPVFALEFVKFRPANVKIRSENVKIRSANDDFLSANEEIRPANEKIRSADGEIRSANNEIRSADDEIR